jgi:hypothetical protein
VVSFIRFSFGSGGVRQISVFGLVDTALWTARSCSIARDGVFATSEMMLMAPADCHWTLVPLLMLLLGHNHTRDKAQSNKPSGCATQRSATSHASAASHSIA